jgi:hypothetical protein
MLAAYATAEGCEFTVYVITGERNVHVVGSPTTIEWGLLAIVAATLPLAGIVGWLASRLSGSRTRTIAAAIGAMVTATIFFILGLILLSPPLLAQWTNHGASKGTLLGMTLPLPEALIHLSLFLAALTFMYLSARSVTANSARYSSIR